MSERAVFVTQQEFARLTGQGTRNVYNLTQSGVIPAPTKGKGYELEPALLAYVNHLREVAAGRGRSPVIDLAEERAKLAESQREAQDLKNAFTRGELLDREATGQWIAAHISTAKTRLRAIRKEAAVAGIPRKHCIAFGRLVDDALRELSGELPDPAPKPGRAS